MFGRLMIILVNGVFIGRINQLSINLFILREKQRGKLFPIGRMVKLLNVAFLRMVSVSEYGKSFAKTERSSKKQNTETT